MKPILFNTKMVRAILDGRKTTTRRVIKPQPSCELRRMNDECHYGQWHEYSENPLCDTIYKSPWGAGYPGPLGNVGDVLYVRETFAKNCCGTGFPWLYKASPEYNEYEPDKWRPSIHMPREAARIFLKVTNVWAERLQDITDDGAEKESCTDATSTAMGFFDIWDSTIKKADLSKYGWNANPWVWVIEFERCEKPEENDK
jgi:hypothetical protein